MPSVSVPFTFEGKQNGKSNCYIKQCIHVIEYCINFSSYLCVVNKTDTKRLLETSETITCLIPKKKM